VLILEDRCIPNAVKSLLNSLEATMVVYEGDLQVFAKTMMEKLGKRYLEEEWLLLRQMEI
jgi:hypothetical protein